MTKKKWRGDELKAIDMINEPTQNNRHSRVGGNPWTLFEMLDSRLRGNDGIKKPLRSLHLRAFALDVFKKQQ